MRSLPVLALAGLASLAGCRSHPPMPTVDHVDLDRFMGDWYVIANIPTSIEEGAHNAVESYERIGDDRIATTFTFREDSFDGERKVYHPTGFVRDTGSNAEWGMQFVWPFKSDFRIVYLDDAYRVTAIGRKQRDHAWIMAREPEIAPEDYARAVDRLVALGYDAADLQRVPQRWE